MTIQELTELIISTVSFVPRQAEQIVSDTGLWLPILALIIEIFLVLLFSEIFHSVKEDTDFKEFPFFVRMLMSRETYDRSEYSTLGFIPIIKVPIEGKLISASVYHELGHVLFRLPWILFQPATGIIILQGPFRFLQAGQGIFTLATGIHRLFLTSSLPLLIVFLKETGLGAKIVILENLLLTLTKYWAFALACCTAALIEETLANAAAIVFLLLSGKLNKNSLLVILSSMISYTAPVFALVFPLWIDVNYGNGESLKLFERFLELAFKVDFIRLIKLFFTI